MTEASVKSRQQPKWHVPVAQPAPVLKFQNSLTKTKVRHTDSIDLTMYTANVC